jgi:hypothetical protein
LERVTIVRNPASDREFARAIDEALAGGASAPEALEARLKQRYPHVLVRARDLESEPALTWYVYREGHWVAER